MGYPNNIVFLGWYNELSCILRNLSEPMFMECIIYMYTVSLDYFNVIQNKLDRIEVEVLEVSVISIPTTTRYNQFLCRN